MLFKDDVTALQAHEHEIVEVSNFYSVEEYVLYLMHLSDYLRAQRIVAGKSVLDLGCNNGYGTDILSKRCTRIVGVDVSPTAVATAKSKYQSKTVSFQQIDGQTLPFNEDSFDVITSFQVIEHLPDYDGYFSEIRRVLRPEGVLLLTTPNACIRVLPGAKPWNRFHVREFRPDELASLVSGKFKAAQVFGQFAAEHTHSVEYERCIRARDSAGESRERTLKTLVAPYVPRVFKDIIRQVRGSPAAVQRKLLTDEVKESHSVNDFFYRDEGMDKSLSLVACCSDSSAALIEAAQCFLSAESK